MALPLGEVACQVGTSWPGPRGPEPEAQNKVPTEVRPCDQFLLLVSGVDPLIGPFEGEKLADSGLAGRANSVQPLKQPDA